MTVAGRGGSGRVIGETDRSGPRTLKGNAERPMDARRRPTPITRWSSRSG